MEHDENKDPQENDSEKMEDLDVGDEAENVSGGARRSDPDAGAQRA
ncbi:MAG TPA: hypothetical protein VNJ54_01230 [Plantibacter sp.]|nr:hypothetical protein [Plantibacter sp.]